MVPRKQGLIINISSFGGVRYILNAAYGVGKVRVTIVEFFYLYCFNEKSKIPKLGEIFFILKLLLELLVKFPNNSNTPPIA